MKIRKLFSEIARTNESLRTSNYVDYLGLQHQPGMQCDAICSMMQLLAKIYTNI